MARHILAGILGCVVGVLPLVLVNVLANGSGSFGAVETQIAQNAVLFGAAALLGGAALGGSVAGWVAGRRGGALGAGVAGTLAAILYAVIVILLVVGGARQGWGPPIAALHPLRTSAAILLVATLLLGAALISGGLAGGGQPAAFDPHGARSRAAAPRAPGHTGFVGQPTSRDPRDARPMRGSGPYRPPHSERLRAAPPSRPPAGRSAPRRPR